MGWWTDEIGRTLRDGPLDIIMDASLEEIADEYLAEQGRKPTLEELLQVISLALKDRVGEITSDG